MVLFSSITSIFDAFKKRQIFYDSRAACQLNCNCIYFINREKTNKYKSVENSNAKVSVVFPLKPIVKTKKYIMNISFVHNRKCLNVQILGIILNMIIKKWVHVFYKYLNRGLVN